MNKQKIIESIKSWDCKDIRVLKNFIDELDEILGSDRLTINYEKIDDLIDITSLPSSDKFSPENTDWPIWAWDETGRCLTGETMDEISTLDECRHQG